jgi:RNA polymerase sigma-70 factor (ECF subfamily)
MLNQVESIWRAHREGLAAYIRRRAISPEAARDILQDVAVKMLGAGDALALADNPRAWLFAVTRNAVIDHYRRKRSTAELDPDLPGPEGEVHDFEEIGRCLTPMIEALPVRLREAWVMSDLHGLKQHEVAQRLRITLPAAKSRILRGRADLRRRIEECCELKFDVRGSLMDYTPRPGGCPGQSGQSR